MKNFRLQLSLLLALACGLALRAQTTPLSGGTGVATDATITFTDITTNNASVSKHGFLPKLSGNASDAFRGDGTYGAVGTGTVTSASFTGGLISVATATTTPAFTVAGTSGGVPYFSSATTWTSSSVLSLNSLVIGGGAGGAPSTTTTATGILTFLGTPSSANLIAALTDETGTGAAVFANTPTLVTPNIGAATGTSLVLTDSVTTGSGGGVAGAGWSIQGTAPTPPANSIGYYSPASVPTAYGISFPSAPTTGVVLRTGASSPQAETTIAPGSSGNVLTSNGTTWASSAAAGGTPGGSGSEIQYRGGASTFSAVTNSSVSGATILLGNAEALATTPTAYLTLRNTTAAANGAQQYSPSLDFRGKGWDSTASASKDSAFRMFTIPAQTAGNPTGSFSLQYSTNAGAYADVASFSSSGNLTLQGGITIANASGINTNSRGSIGFTADGVAIFYNNSQNGWTKFQLGGTSASFAALVRSGATLQAKLADDSAYTQFISKGTATNDDAVAGNLGELVSSAVASGSAVSLTTNTAANMTSISLTAGDWDVTANVNLTAAAATVTAMQAGLSSTTATLPTDGTEAYSGVLLTVASSTDTITLPRKRFSLSGTTTIYAVTKVTFSAGTEVAFGAMTARRVR